jgi:multisubunit Na+/H+ antiporter MnhG subunit
MRSTTFRLMVLVTIVWALFLTASAAISFLVLPVINNEVPSAAASTARVVLGLAVFGVWVYVWHMIAELWLYRVLARRR